MGSRKTKGILFILMAGACWGSIGIFVRRLGAAGEALLGQFTDLDPKAWYRDGVLWAESKTGAGRSMTGACSGSVSGISGALWEPAFSAWCSSITVISA